MSKQFIPKDFQPELAEQVILNDVPSSSEEVPLDILFVGGGPAGLAGAIELTRLIKADGNMDSLEVGVLEKAATLGGHTLSGAVINPISLRELFPDLKDEDLPLRQAVTKDSVYFLTSSGRIPIPTPPTMHNKGNYVASLCEVVRWMGEKAEDLGVNILTSFPADSLLVENGTVIGVRTTPAGLKRDGQPGDQHMGPTDIRARITVLCEGTRGTLTQGFIKWQNLEPQNKQIYALGVKEVWRTKKVPTSVIHTMGWPLPRDSFGGSFCYPMGDDLMALGLVVGLDYKQHNLDVHEMLQALKKHPLFAQYLTGGEVVEWGAKTIPEGGYYSLPKRLHHDGLLIAGDSAGFVNVPALKGIHYAIKSGILAARTIFEGLKNNDLTKMTLSKYDQAINKSYIHKDLYNTRHMRNVFKSGFFVGGTKAALLTLTGGNFPGYSKTVPPDNEEFKTVGSNPLVRVPEGSLSKVDAVYLSGNKTRDDIPQHLTVGKDISADVAEFYCHMCPAGVYERNGDQLIVNAPNCIDCKATDVLGPRWQPREGGSGPNYTLM